MKKRLLLLLLSIIAANQLALAQRENTNWYFGDYAALNFSATGSPMAITGSLLSSREGCSSVSDAAGNLLCYSNGVQVWDRTNSLMPNGNIAGTSVSATQGPLLLPNPGNAQQHYLFTVDAVENNLVGGCATPSLT